MDYIEPNSKRWLNLDDLPGEEWRDIKDFEGLYQISNYGRVKSLGRIKNCKSSNQFAKFNSKVIIKERIMKLKKDRYLRVQLYDKNGYSKYYSVHKLVGKTFIKNNDNTLIIDHKNNNTYDNRVNNLQWVTYSDNAKYSYDRGRVKKIGKEHHLSRLIGQFDLNGNLLAIYHGSGEASRFTGISDVTIRQACRGGYGVKTRKGYIWKYI